MNSARGFFATSASVQWRQRPTRGITYNNHLGSLPGAGGPFLCSVTAEGGVGPPTGSTPVALQTASAASEIKQCVGVLMAVIMLLTHEPKQIPPHHTKSLRQA
ncbi:hypothetical protein EYF80_003843 [Liparis tanakae]|uniref:Uncharacterized protein n=1 Tax=Liparis tanakae TaxID=230148 RepID=A0A4Z2J730_9TELE|nr:hypothetical protein EYF80_003843 [Liparis tanakae]